MQKFKYINKAGVLAFTLFVAAGSVYGHDRERAPYSASKEVLRRVFEAEIRRFFSSERRFTPPVWNGTTTDAT